MMARRDAEAAPRPAGALVAADGLAAGYAGRPIWTGATFAVHPGEFIAVLGPNGSGKSTLLRLLLGQISPLAGNVTVLGAPPRRGNPDVGYVPQARLVDPETAVRGIDLVRLGLEGHRWGPGSLLPTSRRAVRARVDAAVAAVGAGHVATTRVGLLSGGERQRLWLAQALVGDPELLLLDEPLAGLDLASQAAVTELIASIVRDRGLGALLVAHDVNPLLPHVDRVLYLAGGSVTIGTPAEVVNSEALSRLYGAPVEVLRASSGRLFVVGLGDEAVHQHDHTIAGHRHSNEPPGLGPGHEAHR